MPGLVRQSLALSVDSESPVPASLREGLELGLFDSVDVLMAEEFSEGKNEEWAWAFLSRASRAGHLCVHMDPGQLSPSLNTLMEGEVPQEWEGRIVNAFQCLSETEAQKSGWIVQEGGYYYLARNWQALHGFKQHLDRLLGEQADIAIDEDRVRSLTTQMEEEGSLLAEQAEAIRLACGSSLSLITGGPGTGKTYTAGHLIRLILQGLDAQQRQKVEVVAAAPTGKAASMLQASLGKALQSTGLDLSLTARTLHALLQVHRKDRARYLSADLILVDESSMIDAKMMGELFAAVKKGARLILLGDKDQLPPVEVGSLFADLSSGVGKVPRVHLKTCLRAELKDILLLAESVNQGEEAKLLAMSEDLPSDAAQFRRRLLEVAESAFPQDFDRKPEELLVDFLQFRILSPLRRGKFGVEGINSFLLQYFQERRDRSERFVAPIMISKNDYRLSLFNGEVGVLVRDKGEEYALFPGEGGQGVVRRIPRLLLSSFEYAYCLSIHKSQGSEFNRVLMVIPPGSEGFGREVLYTGVTRARQQVAIWGSDDTLRSTVRARAERLSGLKLDLGAPS